MKVMARVETDVEVEIGADEIVDAMFEMPNEKCTWVLGQLMTILGRIGDERIRTQMSDEQRKTVHEFCLAQAKRYAVNGPESR